MLLGRRLKGAGFDGSPWKCWKVSVRTGTASEAAVLVHGLFLYGFHLGLLAWRLSRDGYDVYVCDYPTRRFGIQEHGEAFLRTLDAIAAERAAGAKSLHIVTHSLGGIIARVALSALEKNGGREAKLKALTASTISRMVMLAPPNKGSDAARLACKLFSWAGSFAKPLPELSSAPESFIHRVPTPESFEIGIVAGSCDLEAPPPCAELATASETTVLTSDHTFMPFYPHVYRKILSFLRTGSFK